MTGSRLNRARVTFANTRATGVPVLRSARSNHEIGLCVCIALSVVAEPHCEFSLQLFISSREFSICAKSVTERELRPQLFAVSRRDIQVMATFAFGHAKRLSSLDTEIALMDVANRDESLDRDLQVMRFDHDDHVNHRLRRQARH